MTTLEIIQKYNKGTKSDFKGLVKYYLEYASNHIKDQTNFLPEELIRKLVASEVHSLIQVLVPGEEQSYLTKLFEELQNVK